MKLTVLIENTKPDGSELKAEHGLSFLVETARRSFIFDCGHTGAAFDNAEALGVDVSGIKLVALSHAHYDHAGGFRKLCDLAQVETLITGENFWEEKFSREGDGFKYRGCGFDEDFLKTRGIEQVVCRDVIELDATAWLVGNFKRRYAFETIPRKFVRGSQKVLDDFQDEIALVVREGDGLAIVTACAHCGVLNIVADVRDRFALPIVSVIGGLHLTGATRERIFKTLRELEALGVKKILPCHCSGEEFMSNASDRIKTGSVIQL